MKTILIALLFTATASAQFSREVSVLVDVATLAGAEGDSALITEIPNRSVVTECAIVVDTSCVGVDSALVKFKDSQNVPARKGGFEIVGQGVINRPDEYVGEKESVYLHLQGEPSSGRIRVYIKWIEMY